MKKLFATWLIAIYMVSAIGITFSLHYCGGTFEKVCFTSDTEEGCCGTKEKSNHCCHDEVVKVKITDDQAHTVKSILAHALYVYKVAVNYTQYTEADYPQTVRLNSNDSSPPLVRSLALFLYYRVLRI